MRLMTARCNFVIAAALISQARIDDKIDEQLQRYLEARHHILEFDTFFSEQVNDGPETEICPDLLSKMTTLFIFDFEGAIHLKNWDDLNQIVRKAEVCKDETMYKAMGDCLLRSEAPGNGKRLFMFDKPDRRANDSSCVRNYVSHHQPDTFARKIRQQATGQIHTLSIQGHTSIR